MATTYDRGATYLAETLSSSNVEELAHRLRPVRDARGRPVPKGTALTPDGVAARWALLPAGKARAEIFDAHTASRMRAYEHNIENFIGTVKLPIGLIGPLRVNGLSAHGDYYVPLATTEAALVASYGRGASVIADAGGASAMVLNEGVARSPALAFHNLEEVGRFLSWALRERQGIQGAAESTTRHGQLVDLQFAVDGNHVYLLMVYRTGDAAGQNIAAIATAAALDWLLAHSPVKPRAAYVEANLSGDKKASMQSLQSVRGKKVTAEVCLPAELVQRRLHTTPDHVVAFSRIATTGSILSGAIGAQGHYANGLAALFIACGQDAACVGEAAIGVTRFETTAEGQLYVSVTLPNLIVGTVGGGTGLPSQKACLELLGLPDVNPARAFAEVAACLCLAGEISIAAALASGEFTQAHVRFARMREHAR